MGILCIVPYSQTDRDAIAHYARTVCDSLSSKGVEINIIDSLQTKNLPYKQKKESALLEYIENHKITTLVINYSGYGYQKKGMPYWLIKSITEVRTKHDITILTFFHELYASGPIYTLSFWTHYFQKQIFKYLLKVSHKVICSNSRMAKLIERENIIASQNLYIIPILSNVGEITTEKLINARTNQIVIFGTLGLRKKVYDSNLFYDFIKQLNIDRVIDIGTGNIQIPDYLPIKVEKYGFLSAKEVSNLLLVSKWAAISYPQSLLAKSGVFAAYAAHACCVVNFDSYDDGCYHDGLKSGIHYITPEIRLKMDIINSIPFRLYDWYQEHNIQKHTALFCKLIK